MAAVAATQFSADSLKKLSIAVPWNNSSYIPCNGFHPLYQALFDDIERTVVTLNIVDEPALARRLASNAYLEGVIDSERRFGETLEKKWGRSKIATEFVTKIGLGDLWATSRIPGAVEFHHTCPLTTGDRPFVLHCESFVSMFMPFTYQGAGFMKRPKEIRAFYGALLASPNCLGIYSHLQETLEQIKTFFGDPRIDTKLGLTRIGVGDATYRSLAAPRQNGLSKVPCFLFTSSARQQPISFMLRGGHAALLFMAQYLRHGHEGLFIFRCGRPKDTDLEQFGVDIGRLHEAENNQHVIWVGGYLPENELLALFQQADFFLLPSANLHSVSIMQAQLAGAIPVVSDTLGPDQFVDDGRTGVVLRGVRDAIWRIDPRTGIECDVHRLWSRELAEELASQMYERITHLITDRPAFLGMRQATRTYAQDHYRGAPYREGFFADLRKKQSGHPLARKETRNSIPTLPIIKRPAELFRDLFGSPPAPIPTLLVEGGSVYWLKGTYWFYPGPVGTEFRCSWSPLDIAKRGQLGVDKVEVAWELKELQARLLPLGASGAPTSAYLRGLVLLRQFYVSYPVMRALLKGFVPLIKRSLAWLERSLMAQEQGLSRSRGFLARVAVTTPLIRPIARGVRYAVRQVRQTIPGTRQLFAVARRVYSLCFLSLRVMVVVGMGIVRYSKGIIVSLWARWLSGESEKRF